MSPAKARKNCISRVTFNAAVKPILSLFGEAANIDVYKILASYFTAFRSGSESNKLGIPLTNPIVFRAILQVFPELAQRVKDKNGPNYSSDNFLAAMSDMFRRVKPSVAKDPGSSASVYAKHFQDALKTRSIL